MARRITKLVQGGKIFESTGFSLVKITVNGKKDYLELPIKSTGVAEYQDNLRDEAPKPPIKKEIIEKSSKEGQAMGLLEDRLTQVFDLTDEGYLMDLENHNQDFIWRVIVFAIDLDWELSDGTVAVSYEDKKSILQSNNITGAHTNQIFDDVQGLTKIAKQEEAFLSEN